MGKQEPPSILSSSLLGLRCGEERAGLNTGLWEGACLCLLLPLAQTVQGIK